MTGRAPGRHRDGQPQVPVYRQVWDGPARAEAERLNQRWLEWTVFYSLSKRAFYAVASWDSPHLVMVEDSTSEGLEQQMGEMEMARWARGEALLGPLPLPSPTQTRRGGDRSQAPAAAPPYPPYRPRRRRGAA
ncbi:hypothetical protein [Streptosporangium saharense]|uniref:hypothetical protein n=1 Tax=Streptosporangium saharense TaxID=1706840 RepID=UPI00341FA748